MENRGHMENKRRTISQERRGQRVEVGLRPHETPDDAQAEFERSFDFGKELIDEGVKSFRSYYRWIGPFKFLAYKEVGPPPWQFPRVAVQPCRGNHPSVRFIVGWRSTAYALFVMWFGRHKP